MSPSGRLSEAPRERADRVLGSMHTNGTRKAPRRTRIGRPGPPHHFGCASHTACVQAPVGALEITGSEPPANSTLTVRS